MSGAVLMLGAMLVLAGVMAALVASPRVTAVGIGAGAIAVTLGCVYVCGVERGFQSPSYVGKILDKMFAMQKASRPPPERSDWKDDGL